MPSTGLLKICQETEECIMRMLNSHGSDLPRAAGVSNTIIATVLPVYVENRVFSALNKHMFDSTAVNIHLLSD